MSEALIKTEILELRNKCEVAYVGSINDEGYPQIKGMFVLEHERLDKQYFSTNLSSKHTQQFLENSKAAVYYCDENSVKGALFSGTMEVCTDYETKSMLWREGFEIYYPKGVDDEDYCVLKFNAVTVNYYHGLNNVTVLVGEL